MKRKYTGLILVLMLFSFILTPSLSATIKGAVKQADISFLNDSAQLLTDAQKEDISDKLSDLSNKLDLQVVVLTVQDTGTMELEEYADEYLDNYHFSKNCVILAINMDPYDRKVQVHGYGKCKIYINSKRAQTITDGMVSDLKAENYYDAILFYINRVDYYMNHKAGALIPILGGLLLGSMVLATIIVLIMVHNAGGKNTTTCSTYLDASSSRILAKRDIYTHTTTTRTKKSSSSNNKRGGGGGHGSHSSGSSSF